MAVVIVTCRLFLNCTQCVLHGISGFQHSIQDGTINHSFMLHVQRYLKVNAEKFTIPIDDPVLVDQFERTLTYALVFLCMCILYSCFGLMFVLRKKAVYKAQLRDYNREIETIVFEVDAKRLQEQKLKKEVSSNTREITMLLLYLILKNQMLSMVSKEISKFAKISNDEIPTSLAKLASKITMSLNIEKNLEFLRENSEVLNSNFLDRLLAKYSNLTPSELKLCALLKNKIDSKEIAHSLEISRDSAKIAKHRLKRKLGLKREENLDDFLQMFDEGGPSNQDQNGRQVDLYSMELP